MARAQPHPRPLMVPAVDNLDPAAIRVAYDHEADTLWVSLVGEPPPAYNVYVADDTMYRVDPHTGEVVGLEIERFLEHALKYREETG